MALDDLRPQPPVGLGLRSRCITGLYPIFLLFSFSAFPDHRKFQQVNLASSILFTLERTVIGGGSGERGGACSADPSSLWPEARTYSGGPDDAADGWPHA